MSKFMRERGNDWSGNRPNRVDLRLMIDIQDISLVEIDMN